MVPGNPYLPAQVVADKVEWLSLMRARQQDGQTGALKAPASWIVEQEQVLKRPRPAIFAIWNKRYTLEHKLEIWALRDDDDFFRAGYMTVR